MAGFPSSSSTFWRQSSGAIPGRVNQTKSGGGGGGAAALHTFQHFQDSVSDAWDIDEPLTPIAAAPLTAAAAVPDKKSEKKTASTADGGGITPTHSSLSQQSVRLGPRVSRQSPPKQIQSPDSDKERSRCTKFEKVLADSPVKMLELEKLSWSGVPQCYRTRVWKMLCGYLPAAAGKADLVLQRKREEYTGYVNQYFNNKEEDIHKDTFRQISIDVPRMSPLVSLFQQKCVQEMVERILYIWAIRHPASGYVQGINDLVTPFLMVFLQDFVDTDVTRNHFQFDSLEEGVRKDIEADAFWCMTKVLEGIQDNYTFAQPGIQVKIRQLEELVKRVDSTLHNHIVHHEVQYLQFSFRWMNNLLLRELPLTATIRLWDTYLSETEGFSKFHLYVCAAFLIRWKQDLLQKKDFQGILLFIQNVPTEKWNDKDISLLVAEAYRLKYTFADAPNHLPDCRIKTTL